MSSLKETLAAFTSAFVMLAAAPAHAWTIKLDFNNRNVGDKVYSGAQHFSDAAGATVVSDCAGFAQDGNCAEMSIKKGCDGFGTWGGRINFKNDGVSDPVVGTKLWYSIKVYVPSGFDPKASPYLKFLRVHTTSAATQNEGYNDLLLVPKGTSYFDPNKGNLESPPLIFNKEFQDRLKRFGAWGSDEFLEGVWQTYEVYLAFDNVPVANGGTSRVRVWKNGQLLGDFDDIQTLLTAQSHADAALIFTYWNGGNAGCTGSYPTQDQHLFVDDITLTTDTPSNHDAQGNPMIGDVVGGSGSDAGTAGAGAGGAAAGGAAGSGAGGAAQAGSGGMAGSSAGGTAGNAGQAGAGAGATGRSNDTGGCSCTVPRPGPGGEGIGAMLVGLAFLLEARRRQRDRQ